MARPSEIFKKTIAAQIHFVSCLMAIAGCGVLAYLSYQHSPLDFIACLVFGVTSVLVFAASTVYHTLSDGFQITPEFRKWLKNIDHFSIYFFIAGSYTVFLINAVSRPWSIILLVAVWAIAIFGVLYTHYKTRLPRWAQHRFVYTSIFLIMGWLIIIRLQEMANNLSSTALCLLISGGLSYSIGAIIYATKRPRLFENIFGFHELWHIMVTLGYGFHYFAVLSFYRN